MQGKVKILTPSEAKIVCKKCGRPLAPKEYYTKHDGTKFDMCKKCLTMHVDMFDESTYDWILKEADIPLVRELWERTRNKAIARDPTKINGTTMIGKYMALMRLGQYGYCTYADSDRLNGMKDMQAGIGTEPELDSDFVADMKQKFEAGEISEAQYKTYISTDVKDEKPSEDEMKEKYQQALNAKAQQVMQDNPYDESQFMDEEEFADYTKDLSPEDRMYLALKWGRLYRPNEWIELEQNYNQMTESFDIEDADTINTLKVICKTNLKMNQALDAGDIDTYQKLAKTYDFLRKSAKFTAAQNKKDNNAVVDSIGELVAQCERETGFIPRFDLEIPQDKVDLTLKDMNQYVYNLVTQDLGFGQQIENALKKIQIQKEMDAQEEAMIEENEDEEIFGDFELADEDIVNFYQEIDNQRLQDKILTGDEKE